MEVWGNETGALVAASFFKSPGRKNDAGETLVPALMPEQPTHTNASAVANIANNRKFQFNFTLHSIKQANIMATFNSAFNRAVKWRFAAVIFIFAAAMAFADSANAGQNKNFAQRAETEFHRAQTELQTKTNDSTVAWQFARACYDFADFSGNDNQRAALANQGIDVCRQLIARDPKIAAAHYYLAMNLGQLARTKSVGALKLVKQMESEFKTALELNDHFDFGGSARSLGLLYRDAPGWPMSIGSKRKAKTYLEQSLKIAPDFPENHLNLAESDLKWREGDAAKQELDALDALWPQAQKSFTGEKWERDWAGWTARRAAARKKLADISASAKSPRDGK